MDYYIVGWMQERPISAPGPRTTYVGARLKNEISRRPVEERPISAPDSRTTYLKHDFCFSDFVVAALRDFNPFTDAAFFTLRAKNGKTILVKIGRFPLAILNPPF